MLFVTPACDTTDLALQNCNLRRLHAVLAFRRLRLRRGQICQQRLRLLRLRGHAGDTGREDGHGLNLRWQGTEDLYAGHMHQFAELLEAQICFSLSHKRADRYARRSLKGSL